MPAQYSVLDSWLQLAEQYAKGEAGELAQNYLYACAYYQCALAEYQANPVQYPDFEIEKNIYQPLLTLKKKLLGELTRDYPIFSFQSLLTNEEKIDVKSRLLKDKLRIFRQQYFPRKLQLLKNPLTNEFSFNQANFLDEAEQLLNFSNQIVKNVLQTLWRNSFEELSDVSPTFNKLPCHYAIIAFGSLADGLATLHSDLEFGILIADERHKQYFRCIAQLMQFNTILLGETTLNILRPPEYGKPEFAELFNSCKIPNGISFDGAGEGGGKTPLGVKGLFELIGTPADLAAYQQRDWSIHYHTLPLDIAHTKYITGSKDGEVLYENYCKEIKSILAEKGPNELTVGQQRALSQLTADLERFAPKVGRETAWGRDYAAKHDFLRLPVFVIRYLAFFQHILPEPEINQINLWRRLNDLKHIFRPLQVHFIKELLILSGIVRFECYLSLQAQIERISIEEEYLHCLAKQQPPYVITKNVRDKLYATLLPLHDALQSWRQTQDANALQFQPYDTAHPLFQARLAEHLLNYQLADQRYQQAISLTHSSALQMNVVLAYRARLQGKRWDSQQTKHAISSYKTILTRYENKLGKDSLAVATCKAELANQYALLGKYDKALQYIDEAIHCFQLQRGDTDLETTHCELMRQQILQVSHPDQSLLQRLYEAYQRRQLEPAVQQGLNYYVEPQATKELIHQERVELLPKLREFINDEHLRLLLLLGDSGSGKSLTLHYFERELWQPFEDEGKLPIGIPLFIELKSLRDVKNRDFLPEFLQREYNYSSKQIQQLKRLYSFIFILDGYDELTGVCHRTALYQQTIAGKWNAKTIISCRTQYLSTQQDYSILLSTGVNLNSDRVYYYLAPFKIKLIKRYLENYLAKQKKEKVNRIRSSSFPSPAISSPSLRRRVSAPAISYIYIKDVPEWDVNDYINYYQSIPSLIELISSPLLLQIVTQAVQQLLYEHPKYSQKSVTRFNIYQAFTREWFQRELKRIVTIVDLPGEDFQQRIISFEKFACSLAAQMWQEGIQAKTNLILEIYSPPPEKTEPWEDNIPNLQEKNQWEKFFTDQHPQTVQARAACPLRRIGDYRYSFIHKSFVEYFLSVYFLRELEFVIKLDNIELANELPKLLFSQSLLTLEPAVIEFLSEKLQIDGDKMHWLRIVQCSAKNFSKTEEKPIYYDYRNQGSQNADMSPALLSRWRSWKARQNAIKTAAANAITVLKFAKFSFSNLDLSRVRIKGADLNQGILQNTQFIGANVKNVCFKQAVLRDADFSEAKMAGVELGESYFDRSYKEAKIICICFSHDSKKLAIGYSDGTVEIIASLISKETITYNNQLFSINCVSFNENNTWLAIGGEGNVILIRDIVHNHCFSIKKHTATTCLAWRGNELFCDNKNHEIYVYKCDTDTSKAAHNQLSIRLSGKLIFPGCKKINCFALQRNWLIAGSETYVYLWELSGNTKEPAYLYPVSEGAVTRLVFYDIDHFAFTTYTTDSDLNSYTIKLCKINFLKIEPVGLLQGHVNAVQCLSAAIEKKLLASCSKMGVVRLWDPIKIKDVLCTAIHGQFGDQIQCISLSPNGEKVASVGKQRDCDIIFLSSLPISARDLPIEANVAYVLSPNAFCYANKAEWNYITIPVNENQYEEIKRLTSGTTSRTLSFDELQKIESITGHEHYRAEDRFLQKTIRIWHTNSRSVDKAKTEYLHWMGSISVSCALSLQIQEKFDLKYYLVTTSNYDDKIRFWSLSVNKTLKPLEKLNELINTSKVINLSFNPVSPYQLYSSTRNSILLWDLYESSYRQLGDFSVKSFAWTKDGMILAMGRADGTISLYYKAEALYVSTGILIDLQCDGNHAIDQLAWDDNSERLAIGNEAGLIIVWKWRQPILEIMKNNSSVALVKLALASKEQQLFHHQKEKKIINLAWSKGNINSNVMLASATSDTLFIFKDIFDIPSYIEITGIKSKNMTAAKLIHLEWFNNNLVIWRASGSTELWTIDYQNGCQFKERLPLELGIIRKVYVSLDKSFLITLDGSGGMSYWSISDLANILRQDAPSLPNLKLEWVTRPVFDAVNMNVISSIDLSEENMNILRLHCARTKLSSQFRQTFNEAIFQFWERCI